LKILQVASSLNEWGGIERYVTYLQSGLSERGHEVQVTCPPKSPLSERTAKQHPIQVKGKHDLRAFAQYLRLFRDHRYDIVHIHFNPDFLVAGIAARLRKQTYTVLTRHVALPWSSAKVRLYSPLFDHIIPVSHAVEKQLLASGIPQSRMTVAKAGCPCLHPTKDRDATRRELRAEGFAIGSFGRMTPEKGLDLLEQVSVPGVSLHLFGSGPLLEQFKAKQTSTFRVHGFRTDVADCMNAMDAIVIPSRWEEAFPYAALEAMSLAKPILVSRVGGLLEIVEEGNTGLAFDKDNAEQLAQAIHTVQSCSTELGASAKRRHAEEFTVPFMAARIEAVYRNASASG
jgi:glycosyltransferase involved in cell wall biosynthesis